MRVFAMIAADLAAIPGSLTGLPRWLVWRNESRGGKQTKVPKTARNTAATSTSPDTWASFDAIADVIRRQPRLFDGPGIVLGDLGDGEHLCGIDLDLCLNDDGCDRRLGQSHSAPAYRPTARRHRRGGASNSSAGVAPMMRERCGPPSASPMAHGAASVASARTARITGRVLKSILGPAAFSLSPASSGRWRLMRSRCSITPRCCASPNSCPSRPVGVVVRIARAAPSPSAGARPCADKARPSSKCAPHCAPILKPPSGARRKARPDDGRELRRIWERAAPAAWLDRCQKNEKGGPRSNLANAVLALREAPELRDLFTYDDMLRAPLLVKALPSTEYDFERSAAAGA